MQYLHMASKENLGKAMELINDNQKEKEESILHELQSNTNQVEEIGQTEKGELLSFIDSLHEMERNSSQTGKSSPDIATMLQMAAASLPHSFKGFTSFRGFRRLDINKFNELTSSFNQEILSESSKIIENIDTTKKPIKKKNRKRRKKWVVKKRPCVPKPEISKSDLDNSSSLYQKLYRRCMDVIKNDGREGGNKLNSTSEGNASAFAIPEAEPILDMALEVVNKLKSGELGMRKERNRQQQNQKALLQKLIKLLKDQVPVNGDTDYENNLSSHQIPPDQPTPISDLQRSKNNFYGFRSKNPQTRDRGGIITAEKLFASSPPSSPTHTGNADDDNVEIYSNEPSFPSISSNNIRDLDFVFKPLSNSYLTEESVSDNLRVPSNGIIRNKGPVYRSQRLIVRKRNEKAGNLKMQEGLTLQRKNKNKSLNRRRKTIRKLNSRKNEMRVSKSSQLESKLIAKLEDTPSFRVKSFFTHRRDSQAPSVSDQFSTGEAPEKKQTISKPELPKIYASNSKFSFRGFSGPFGSPKKSDAESSFSDVSTSLLYSVQSKTSPAVIQGVKRKLSNIERERIENQSKVLGSTNDLKLSRSIPIVYSNASGGHKMQPVAKVKPTSVHNYSDNSLKLEALPIISKQSLPGRSHVELHSDKQPLKLPANSPDASTLYYPVHPFISHDLPVHFIPIDANKMPQFLPLYAPEIDFSKNKAPIYPSFIRTRPSAEHKSPAEYFLSKGISTRSIPRRSFAEDKVRENLFSGIASSSTCPLLPEVKTSLHSKHRNQMDSRLKLDLDAAEASTASDVKPETSSTQTSVNLIKALPNSSTNSLASNANLSVNSKQKIHKCLQCDFVTPKLGVLKRHEILHSKRNSTHNDVIVSDSRIQTPTDRQSTKSSSGKVSSLRHPVKRASINSVSSISNRNFDSKLMKKKMDSSQKGSGQDRDFSGFKNCSMKHLATRFPTVSITPLFNKTK